MLLNYPGLLLCGFFCVLSSIEGLVPTPNYRTPRNVIFSTQGGGSSHHMWVLELLEEMHNRGHSVALYSKGDQLRFAKDYPMVKTREVGGPTDIAGHPLITRFHSLHPTIEDIAFAAAEAGMSNYTEEFKDFTEQYSQENISLAICDSYAVSCIDSAIVSKIPVVITSTFAIYEDIGAPYINNRLYTLFEPTSKDQSLWTRITKYYIQVPFRHWILSRKLKESKKIQLKYGLTPAIDTCTSSYNHVPKLVNNVFGIEAARKHSPLVHMAGPIMRKSYPDLDAATKSFLDAHQRVAYVAFGQHALASEKDIKLVLHNLVRLLEEGHIDGIVWARLQPSQLPVEIQTPEKAYTQEELINHPAIYLMDWVPQFATLQHPSTSFFISHGGAGSLHEALFSGVRLFVFPFGGDQPMNARSVQHSGLGRYFNTLNLVHDAKTYESLYTKLRQVAVDPDHAIQDAVNHYSAFMQITASNAVKRGADLLEESMFASDSNGELYYRKDVGYEINWLKRNNYDIVLVFAAVGLTALKLTVLICKSFFITNKLKKE